MLQCSALLPDRDLHNLVVIAELIRGKLQGITVLVDGRHRDLPVRPDPRGSVLKAPAVGSHGPKGKSALHLQRLGCPPICPSPLGDACDHELKVRPILRGSKLQRRRVFNEDRSHPLAAECRLIDMPQGRGSLPHSRLSQVGVCPQWRGAVLQGPTILRDGSQGELPVRLKIGRKECQGHAILHRLLQQVVAVALNEAITRDPMWADPRRTLGLLLSGLRTLSLLLLFLLRLVLLTLSCVDHDRPSAKGNSQNSGS
mmetsp:Transcript_123718/g.276162  ORF Transcript_123718/g.276162 Transcript_123718/m.276162 type:complete len:256 (+) Transcript_123718:293-1060(+)